jgi:hypothetical protein
MIIPDWLKCYGDQSFRGECPLEVAEQVAFFSEIRRCYPQTLGLIALHPKNEQKRKGKQFNTLSSDKAKGFCKSASDIIIPGCPAFICELKRVDHTKSKWQEGQIEYLEAAKNNGAFVCVALGAKAALEALADWMIINEYK